MVGVKDMTLLKDVDPSKFYFWSGLSLIVLFLMGFLYLTSMMCREYLKNPSICSTLDGIHLITPWILFITIGMAFASALFFGLAWANKSLSTMGRRERARLKRDRRAGRL